MCLRQDFFQRSGGLLKRAQTKVVCLTDHPPAAGRRVVGADIAPYGFVVESVNVSVLLYVPVRKASEAPMACLKATVTASLLTGPVQVSSVVGWPEPPTFAAAGPAPAAGLEPEARSGCGSAKAPFTSLP